MYTATMTGLEQMRVQAEESTKAIKESNRHALRAYLQAAFELQRAGLEAVSALQKGLEELTFDTVERVEGAQDKVVADAEARLHGNVQQLREVSETSRQILHENRERTRQTVEEVRTRVSQQQSELQELGQVRVTRLREGTEIGMKVAKVIEKRVESVLGDLFQAGNRQLQSLDARIEQFIEQLDSKLSEDISFIDNYDELNVDEIVTHLDALDAIELQLVRKHEISHKNRITVLRAIDQKLAEKEAMSES